MPAGADSTVRAADPMSHGSAAGSVGLPTAVRACLFDLDGVLTRTALVHAAAWKQTFDEFLRERAGTHGEPFVAFDEVADYETYVDGKPRADGVRDLLASRGITLAEGTSQDPPSADTVHGLGNRKNELLLERIRLDGVEVYPGAVRYLHAVRAAGLLTAVVSSSANTRQVLQVTGIQDQFDARVDAQVVQERGLAGKPAPDSFLAAAADLGVAAGQAAVFEDALAGVAAGRAGGFALVVGVDRVGQAAQLRAHGADVVVKDPSDLLDGGRHLETDRAGR